MDQSCKVEKCVFCSEEYASVKILRTHILKDHSVNKVKKTSYACDQPNCDSSYTRHRELVRHKQAHAGSALSFICQLCGKTLCSKQQLSHHILSQHTARKQSFPCRFCEKTFESKYLLGAHMKKFHPGKGAQKIKRERLIDPEDPSLDVLCRFCNKICTNNWSLSIHMRQIHKEVPKMERILPDNSPKAYIQNESQCKFCSQKFEKKQFLGAHMRVRHPGQGRQSRWNTSKSPNQVENLMMVAIAENSSPYNAIAETEKGYESNCESLSKCETSKESDKKEMPTNAELKKETIRPIVTYNADLAQCFETIKEHGEKKGGAENDVLREEIETKETTVKRELTELLWSNKKNESLPEDKEKENAIGAEEEKIAREVVATKENSLKIEIENKGSSQNVKVENKDKAGNTSQCDECDFDCNRPSTLKDHKYVVHKGMIYKCESCSATFTAKRRLVEHMRMKHEPPLQCDKCEFTASRNIALINHNIRDHGVKREKGEIQDRIHSCSECDFSCNRPYKLKDHQITKHNGPLQENKPWSEIEMDEGKKKIGTDMLTKENALKMVKQNKVDQILSKDGKRKVRIHFCEECPFSCDRPDFLKDHKFTEHEGKLYKCGQCEKTYRKTKNMKEHIKLKHGSENETFLCELCNFHSKWARALKGHQKTKHNMLD